MFVSLRLSKEHDQKLQVLAKQQRPTTTPDKMLEKLVEQSFINQKF